MDTNLFWFKEEQWAKIVPHLPRNQPGPERKDDRQDCPKEYGPHKTVYNRFARWSERAFGKRYLSAWLLLPTRLNRRRWNILRRFRRQDGHKLKAARSKVRGS
jgi:transposase